MDIKVTILICSGCGSEMYVTEKQVKVQCQGKCKQSFFKTPDGEWHNEMMREWVEKELKRKRQ